MNRGICSIYTGAQVRRKHIMHNIINVTIRALTEYCARAYIYLQQRTHYTRTLFIHVYIILYILYIYGRVRVHYTKSGLRHKL